ncbi:hypothetical protein TJA_00020 [Thermus sp. LT1-2-5]
MTLLDLLRALRRSWRWLLGGGLVLGVLVGWTSTFLPPRYVSEVVLQVGPGSENAEKALYLETRILWPEVGGWLLPRPDQLPWSDWLRASLVSGAEFDAVLQDGQLRISGYGRTPEEAQGRALETYKLVKENLKERVKTFWRSYLRGEEMTLYRGVQDLEQALRMLAQENPDPSIRQRFRAAVSLMELRVRQLRAYQEDEPLDQLAEETLGSYLSLLQPAQTPREPLQRQPLRYGAVATLTFWLFASLLVFLRELFRSEKAPAL